MSTVDLALAALSGFFAMWGMSWRRQAKDRNTIVGAHSLLGEKSGKASYSVAATLEGQIEVAAMAPGGTVRIRMSPDQARTFASKIETAAATMEMK